MICSTVLETITSVVVTAWLLSQKVDIVTECLWLSNIEYSWSQNAAAHHCKIILHVYRQLDTQSILAKSLLVLGARLLSFSLSTSMSTVSVNIFLVCCLHAAVTGLSWERCWPRDHPVLNLLPASRFKLIELNLEPISLYCLVTVRHYTNVIYIYRNSRRAGCSKISMIPLWLRINYTTGRIDSYGLGSQTKNCIL